MSSIAGDLLDKFEGSLDVLTVRIDFKDVENIGDLRDANDVSKLLLSQAKTLNSRVEIQDVKSVIDGDKKQFVLHVDYKGKVDKKKFKKDIEKLFTTDMVSKHEMATYSSRDIKTLTDLFKLVEKANKDAEDHVKVPFELYGKTIFYVAQDGEGFLLYDNNKEELDDELSDKELAKQILDFIPYIPDLKLGGKLNKEITEKDFLKNLKAKAESKNESLDPAKPERRKHTATAKLARKFQKQTQDYQESVVVTSEDNRFASEESQQNQRKYHITVEKVDEKAEEMETVEGDPDHYRLKGKKDELKDFLIAEGWSQSSLPERFPNLF